MFDKIKNYLLIIKRGKFYSEGIRIFGGQEYILLKVTGEIGSKYLLDWANDLTF